MNTVTSLTLDVLKTRRPNIVDFANVIAEHNQGATVTVTVKEIDTETETLTVKLTGDDLKLSDVETALEALGASLHSIDEVQLSPACEP